MKRIVFSLFFCMLAYLSFSQSVKVAILDFENVSAKTEYGDLGKALSEMLITDLQNNIHPKKVKFFERTQSNRLLDEQKLQKSKNFDGNTAVAFGKFSGVDYVLVGSVFIFDGKCNITSRLVDVKTSKIILSKAVNGRTEMLVQLKSQLAESIAQQLNNPITIDPSYKDVEITLSTINQYSKVLSLIDQGDFDKAEQFRSVFEETSPTFKYYADLTDDINQLKKQVSELQNIAELLTNSFELANKAEKKSDYKNAIKYFEGYLSNPGDKLHTENKRLYAFGQLAISYYNLGDYVSALNSAQKASKIYAFYPTSNEIELLALIQLNKKEDARLKYNFILDSLTFENELKFRRKKMNDLLEWEIFESVYYGLRMDEYSDDWLYKGIRQSGYGSAPENEIKINAFLREKKVDLKFLYLDLSQYKKIEKKLLELKDPRAFSSEQLLNFYSLSLDFATTLHSQNNYDAYKNHLEKEIKRMEAFGIECEECPHANQRKPIPNSYGQQKDKEFEKIHQTIRDCGLSNSIQSFNDQFPLIYGKFKFSYFITLIKLGSFSEAAQIYKSFLNSVVSDRDSYFYNYYWDILLGLRVINADWDSRQNLSAEAHAKKLNKKIEDQLKKDNISLTHFDNVKNQKIIVNTGRNDIEIDDEINSDKMIWSKNVGLIKDGLGNAFQLANSKENLFKLNRDSTPAYCFYDFEKQNGLRYGKLYNYWAMKLLAQNPPLDWRLARQRDFSRYLKIDSLMELQNNGKNPYQEHIYSFLEFLQILRLKKQDLSLIMAGEWHGQGFCCIDTQARFWTDEFTTEDLSYQKIVDIYSSGEVRFSENNCKDCLFSIRLIKSK